MDKVFMFLNGAFNAFIIGMGIMMFIFIGVIMVLLEQSIAETIKENHSNVKHPHIMSICVIILTGIVLCLLVKLILMILPILWFIIKLLLICGVIIFVILVLIDLVDNLFTKK